MTSFSVSEPPHIRKEESVTSGAAKFFFASLIPIIARLCLAPFSTLALIISVSIGAGAALFIQEKIFRNQDSSSSRDWIRAALVSTLVSLMPVHTSFAMGFLAGSLLIFFGTFTFGKYASFVFHPAALACLLTLYISPGGGTGDLSGTRDLVLFMAAISAGIMLCAMKVISWKAPFVYLTIIAAGFCFGKIFQGIFYEGRVAIMAFFILTDAVTSPLKKSAQMLSAFLAGAMTLVLSFAWPLETAALLSLLLINALSPWFDGGNSK